MKVIHDDPPMRDEIAVGFYPRFEDGWRRTEVVGCGIIMAFVAACMLGLLGPGVLGERRISTADGSLSLVYEPVVRNGTPTGIALCVRVTPGADHVAVTLSRDFADAFGFDRIVPSPMRWDAGAAGVRMDFAVLAASDRLDVRISGTPRFTGRTRFRLTGEGPDALAWSQFGLP